MSMETGLRRTQGHRDRWSWAWMQGFTAELCLRCRGCGAPGSRSPARSQAKQWRRLYELHVGMEVPLSRHMETLPRGVSSSTRRQDHRFPAWSRTCPNRHACRGSHRSYNHTHNLSPRCLPRLGRGVVTPACSPAEPNGQRKAAIKTSNVAELVSPARPRLQTRPTRVHA